MGWRAVVACLLLAGCVQPAPTDPGDWCGRPPSTGRDDSEERLTLFINGSGGFTIRVPVFVSAGGTGMADWVQNLTGEVGFGAVKGERGEVLELRGHAPRIVRSCSIQPSRNGDCCAEQYLHREWSAGAKDVREMEMDVVQGTVSLRYAYDARSDLCGGHVAFQGNRLGVGIHEFAAGAGGEFWCETDAGET